MDRTRCASSARAVNETRCIGGPPDLRGDQRDAPVVVGVLERPRDALTRLRTVDEAALLVRRQARAILIGTVDHRLERPGLIDVDAFENRVRDHRHRVVPDHRVGFVGRKLPHRQASALLILPHHRLHEIRGARAIDERQERVERAKRVPQREHRVVREALRAMDREISPAILPIHVHVDVGRQHRMIERRVEHDALITRAAVDANAAELALPRVAGRPAHGIEVPRRQLGTQVPARAFDADRRNADFHEHLPAAVAAVEQGLSTCAPVTAPECENRIAKYSR